MSGLGLEVMKVTEQTCLSECKLQQSLAVMYCHSLSLPLLLSLSASFSFTSSVISTQGQAKPGRHTDWLLISLLRLKDFDIAVLSTGGGVELSNFLSVEGCKIKDATMSHLGPASYVVNPCP